MATLAVLETVISFWLLGSPNAKLSSLLDVCRFRRETVLAFGQLVVDFFAHMVSHCWGSPLA